MASLVGLRLITGGSRNSGCENCPCCYNPKRLGFQNISTSVRFMVYIQITFSLIEFSCLGWFLGYSSGADQQNGIFKPSEWQESEPRKLILISSIFILLGIILRLLSLRYTFQISKNMTGPGVITARGAWLFTTILALIGLVSFTLLTHGFIVENSNVGNTLEKFTIGIYWTMLIVLILDLSICMFFGCCVVEHFRSIVLGANPNLALENWARRDNARYEVSEGP